jgi:hypothetical protein
MLNFEVTKGSIGWKEFNRNRISILEAFDKAKNLNENRPVHTRHGVTGEAELRKWLAEFLPQKYGVTSGYIIPKLFAKDYKIYHYDVIIYNKLEAPVLWVDGNADESEQGKFRAIPAKYVSCIFEVKATLNKKSAAESVKKLSEINGFKDQLPANFCCGSIFFELKNSENKSKTILPELLKGMNLFKCIGGMILRAEVDPSMIGIAEFGLSEPHETRDLANNLHLARPIDELELYATEEGNIQFAGSGVGATFVTTGKNEWSFSKTYSRSHYEGSKMVHLTWSRSNFSEFIALLLISLEQLPREQKEQFSFGRVFETAERKEIPEQSVTPIKGLPFVKLEVKANEETGEFLTFEQNENGEWILWFAIVATNMGAEEVILSNNAFEKSAKIPPGKTAKTRENVLVQLKDAQPVSIEQVLEEIKSSGSPINYSSRFVYKTKEEKGDYYSLHKSFKITLDKVVEVNN